MPVERVSVILSCRRGGENMGSVLLRLAQQRGIAIGHFEIILVDPGLFPNLAVQAQTVWQHLGAPAPMIVVSETGAGLAASRRTGIAAARHPILSMIDDDVLICPDWCSRVQLVFAQRPAVGVIGARGVAVLPEGTIVPNWFSLREHEFGIGGQGVTPGLQVDRGAVFHGPGLSLRKPALDSMRRHGFVPLLDGGVGEEAELCLALSLAGWSLWYEPSLIYERTLEPGTLAPRTLLAFRDQIGEGAATLDIYHALFSRGPRWPIWLIRAAVKRRQRWSLLALSRRTLIAALPRRDREARFAAMLEEAEQTGHRRAILEGQADRRRQINQTVAWLRASRRAAKLAKADRLKRLDLALRGDG